MPTSRAHDVRVWSIHDRTNPSRRPPTVGAALEGRRHRAWPQQWMDRWTPRLADLTREMLARAEPAISTGLTGARLGPAASRVLKFGWWVLA